MSVSRHGHPTRAALLTLAAALLAGCAAPPDGSKIQRLPESPAPATLSDAEREKLIQLNDRLLAEQEQARAREDALAAQRAAPPPVSLGLNYGYGWGRGWHGGWGTGWFWTGSRWMWRPHLGVELWVPLGR